MFKKDEFVFTWIIDIGNEFEFEQLILNCYFYDSF